MAVPCVGVVALKVVVSPVTLMAGIMNGSSWLPSDCTPMSIRPTMGLQGSVGVLGFKRQRNRRGAGGHVRQRLRGHGGASKM